MFFFIKVHPLLLIIQNKICKPITLFHNIITIQKRPTQILISIFLIEKSVFFKGFLKIIQVGPKKSL